MSNLTAMIEAHSIWWREQEDNLPYALLETAETGMDAVPLLEKTATTTFGRDPNGQFINVVTSTDPPGGLPNFQLNFYEVWNKVHPLLDANQRDVKLFLQRLRFSSPNNMDVRALAKQIDLLEVKFTGGERGAANAITGEGGAVLSNVTFDVELSQTIQMDTSLSRQTFAGADDILSGVILDRTIGRSMGYRGRDKVMYFGLEQAAAPGALMVSLDGGSTFTAMANTLLSGNAGIAGLAWQPLTETTFRLFGGGTVSAAVPNVAYFDLTYGDEASATATSTEYPLTGASADDVIGDILWPAYNRLYIAAGPNIFISTDAGVTVPATPAAAPGQNVLKMFEDAAKNVWAVGASDVILREDASLRGTFSAKVGPGNGDITAIAAADNGVIYVGAGEQIFRSDDDARGNWVSVLTLPASTVIKEIVCIGGSSEAVMAIENDSTPEGTVHRSVDGGLSWTPFADTVNAGYNGALPTSDPNRAFVFGNALGGTGVLEILG